MRAKRTSKKLSLENLEQRQLLTSAVGITQVAPPEDFNTILPYMEQQNLYIKADHHEGTSSTLLLPAVQKMVDGNDELRWSSNHPTGAQVLPVNASGNDESPPTVTAVDQVLADGTGQVSHVRNFTVDPPSIGLPGTA